MSKAAVNIQIVLGTTVPWTDAAYHPISPTPLLFKGSMTHPDSNTLYVQGTDGQGNAVDVPFGAAGQPFVQDYSAVDLSTLKIKGTAEDKITLVGESVENYKVGLY